MSEERKGPRFELKMVESDGGRKTYRRFGNVWRKQFDDGSELMSIQLITRKTIKDERYEVAIEDVLEALTAAELHGDRPPYLNMEVPYRDRQQREESGGSRGRGVQSQSQVRRQAVQKTTVSDIDFDT